MLKQHTPLRTGHLGGAILALMLGLMVPGALLRAATTDISSTPLANTADITAKPNLMFILDSSGSMVWAFMPDDMGQDFSRPNDNPTDSIALSRYGGRSAQCNGVAYNPTIDYASNLPVKSDGTPYPHIPFNAAPTDGFQVSLVSAKTVTNSVTPGIGDKTLTISSSGMSSTSYATNASVAIVNASDDSQWMLGTVRSWTYVSGTNASSTLVVTVTDVVGNADSSVTWKVGTRSAIDLNASSSNSYYYNYNVTGTSAKKPLSWKYTTAGLDRTGDGGFANECLTDTTTTLSTFTKVTVTTSSAEAQNYADWYGYYRKRYLMMRTVAGRSFSPISSKFRVGFTTISNTSAAPSSAFLPVDSFEGAQKIAFYSDLYKADPANSTPLRAALSKVGRYFANKAPGQTTDPMQYACQRNYAILSTDGYWNTGNESTSYGPLQLDGTTRVGQQDATETRPKYDGTNFISTTTTPYTVVKHQKSAYVRTTTTTWSQNVYSTTTSGCNGGKTRLRTQEQRATQTKKETITAYQDVSGSYTNTRVTTNGSLTSDTNSTTTWSNSPTTTSTDTTVTSDSTGAYANYGSSTNSGTCANTTTLPSPNPSTATIVSGPSASNGSTTVTLLSTDAAVAGTANTPVQTTSGGSTDSLADVAEYYYVTDLRTSTLNNCTGAPRPDGSSGDVCNNEVPPNGRDDAATQHMTTFTLGLGVNGVLPFLKNYLDPGLRTGAYYEMTVGSNGTMWPVPNTSTEDATHVDDLWHAAVNGRGQYWATSDPGSLSEAISTALSSVSSATGASSSAATSSLKPVSGENNQVFVATFKTVDWIGDLTAYSLNADTGEIDLEHPTWSAKDRLSGVNASTRRIYYGKPGVSTLRAFNFTTLTADGLGTLFSNACTKTPILSQCAGLDADPKAQLNSGTNMVNFLRGDTSLVTFTYGTPSQTADVFRNRVALLGDLINASPVFMSKPPFQYIDPGYSDFIVAKKDRKAVVFAAANDGMLHAFSANGTDGGQELWAYIPRKVMPNLYQLADLDYKSKHRYFVDGTPVIGDVYDSSARAWKTILVGGLNSGGKGYYALDVTDPENPLALWEFANDNDPQVTGTDANLGLTYGIPIITKRDNGTWVVVFTSGYNNGGDGNGRLYMLNAITGAQEITAIPTLSSGQPVGSVATPSGLGKLNAWVEDDADNKAKRFYAGDLLGNLWRFDTDGLVEPHNSALLLAKFQIDASTPQAITTRPELAAVSYNGVDYPAVFVATGEYLGISDIADRRQQSIYAVKDPLTSSGLGDVRQRSDIVVQTLSDNSSGIRTASKNDVNWSTKNGWRLDLPSAGERVAVDMQLQYTTLAVISAIPGTNECKPSGGSSWLYALDIAKGTALPNAAGGAAGSYLGAYLGVGMTWIELTNGSSKLIIPRSDGKVETATPTVSRTSSSSGAHRTSWRELVN